MPAARSMAPSFTSSTRPDWPSVRAHGLLSANRLAAAAGYDAAAMRTHRPAGLVLPSGARIRDQSPMPPRVLAPYLVDGLKPEDWYHLLNSQVFFWLDPERLNRQRRACGEAPQRALVVNAVRMLEKHGARASVAAINTGNAMRAAAPRGLSTFVPFERWARDAWASETVGRSGSRPPSSKPVELTIEDAVEDILDFVELTVPLGPGEILSRDGRSAVSA